ncbi:unnamed protein product [Soboliphyme baturini]|uniref:MyTH4 domain-containing protein n=1 Tax=Soboliphyme baturini TaxID=241478 RepID=A0A183JAF2_9BILA|nr:unnamed protein product [Soboliphyme baturini]
MQLRHSNQGEGAMTNVGVLAKRWCIMDAQNGIGVRCAGTHFYSSNVLLPKSYLCLEQSKIREAPRSSEEESDASDGLQSSQQYSVELTTAEGDSVYLIFLSAEDKSIYLFSTVPIHGGAEDYHVDLSQNALQLVMNSPGIREEFFCQLIKFINSHLLSHQTWQLLALCLSLFTPVHYPVMWLLKKFLQNQTSTK